MALIDDVEFYGRAVDAGEMDRPQAVRLLAEASNDGLTELGAARWLDDWQGARARLESQLFDVHDAIRALENGRPIPEHVVQRSRQAMRERARASALRMLRRELDLDN
ncbi:hypothetical protein ACWY4P_40735 [Streptomyces sp. LZ34]